VVGDTKVIKKLTADFKKLKKKVFVLSLFDDKSIKELQDALTKLLAKNK
jgi:hypothetical protein